MRRLSILILSLLLAAPVSLMAANESSPLAAAADREAKKLAASIASGQPDAQIPKQGGWISRHPALFGTLVGAGAGTVMSLTMENELFCSRGDEDCLFHGGSRALVGAGMGAGVGALVGWIVGGVRHNGRDAGTRKVS